MIWYFIDIKIDISDSGRALARLWVRTHSIRVYCRSARFLTGIILFWYYFFLSVCSTCRRYFILTPPKRLSLRKPWRLKEMSNRLQSKPKSFLRKNSTLLKSKCIHYKTIEKLGKVIQTIFPALLLITLLFIINIYKALSAVS